MNINIVLHDHHFLVRQGLIGAGEVVDFGAQKVVEDGLEQLEQKILEDHFWDFMVENKDKPLLFLGGERSKFQDI